MKTPLFKKSLLQTFLPPLLFLCIFFIVIFLLFYFFKSPNHHTSLPSLQKIEKTYPYNLNNGELPIPKGFFDSKISGTLNYNHAIKIAQEKYNQGNYQDSLIWTYRAEKISPKKQDTWILYAKNIYKMGYKKQAIAILQYYKQNLQ